MAKVALLLVLSACTLLGCTTARTSSTQYDGTAFTSATRTLEGQIVSKRGVSVNTSRGTGAAAGGALGAVGGSSIGGTGRDNLAGAIVGAVAGSAIGAAVDSSANTISAFEYIVKSDVAGLLTIVQTDDGFSIGDKVFVVLGNRPLIVARTN